MTNQVELSLAQAGEGNMQGKGRQATTSAHPPAPPYQPHQDLGAASAALGTTGMF